MSESKTKWIVPAASDPFEEEADNIIATAEENVPNLQWADHERQKLVNECAAILEKAWHKVEDKVNDYMEAKS